jgi:hypothetical protein
MKKSLRFHRNIYFPTGSTEILEEFINNLYKSSSMVFSSHSVEKIVGYCADYGRSLFKYLLKSIHKGNIRVDNIFEYYLSNNIVKKACFRFSFEELPVDIVLVVSADAVVITVYVVNKNDKHSNMNKALYEKAKNS